MNEPIMDNYSNMIKYVITRFGWTNVLKYIKPHIMTIKKPLGILQDDFLDRMMQLQLYLQLLNRYFPTIIPLDDVEFKDSYVQGQPVIYKNYLTQAGIVIDDVSIEDLLEYFSELQFNESSSLNH